MRKASPIPFLVPDGWEVAYEGQTYLVDETIWMPGDRREIGCEIALTVVSVERKGDEHDKSGE